MLRFLCTHVCAAFFLFCAGREWLSFALSADPSNAFLWFMSLNLGFSLNPLLNSVAAFTGFNVVGNIVLFFALGGAQILAVRFKAGILDFFTSHLLFFVMCTLLLTEFMPVLIAGPAAPLSTILGRLSPTNNFGLTLLFAFLVVTSIHCILLNGELLKRLWSLRNRQSRKQSA